MDTKAAEAKEKDLPAVDLTASERPSEAKAREATAVNLAEVRRMGHRPWEGEGRSIMKAVVYRGWTLMTAVPAGAITLRYMQTGHITFDSALASMYAGLAGVTIVYNSLSYWGFERISSRFHWGYNIGGNGERMVGGRGTAKAGGIKIALKNAARKIDDYLKAPATDIASAG